MPRQKKPEGSPTIQMGIRLPRELRDRLEKAGGERGIAEEIRRRLEASFDQFSLDAETYALMRAVKGAADFAEAFGQWSTDRFTFDALREAINIILTKRFEPPEKPKDTEHETIPTRSAKELGEAIATIWLKQHPREEH